jgi:hypothetical protein
MTAEPTVTIALSQLRAIEVKATDAEAETAKVRAELVAARLASPDDRVAKITAFARDCLTLARFAVAHCPPETIVGWPYDVLRRVADGLEHLPDFGIMDRDMAIDLHGFARECEDYERRRQHVVPSAAPPTASATVQLP